jgi:hypothetical protein
LVFLIILIVATAVLLAWLLVQLARIGLADFRLPRLRESSLGGASPSASPVPPVHGSATEHGGSESESERGRRQAEATLGQRRQRREERVLYDESDVEQAVRDRLYGRHGRHD